MNNKILSILLCDGMRQGKYSKNAQELLNTESLSKILRDKHGIANGTMRLAKTYPRNNTIQIISGRKLSDGRHVNATIMNYESGAKASLVNKRTNKGEIQYTSITYKDPDGHITKQVIQDGDSFTAKIPQRAPGTGETVQVHEYNTNPEAGKIIPDKGLQSSIIADATRGIF